jgi:1-acyl-sn-glycerol-3-phosphate acyltransferase
VGYLWNPKLNIYYVAAKETMNAGLLPRILAYAGSISIERTWRESGKEIQRQVKMSDISNIGKALDDGWVITFPQGTTKPFKPVRKGTAHIIKHYQPIVIPIVIDGFRRSFDKKGLMIKKRGILQSIIIKKPLKIDYENDSIDSIMEKIEYSIEQHPSFLKVIPKEELEAERILNEKRKWDL